MSVPCRTWVFFCKTSANAEGQVQQFDRDTTTLLEQLKDCCETVTPPLVPGTENHGYRSYRM